MNKRETVQALLDAVQEGDLLKAQSMLAEDFQFSGSLPEPIDRAAWLDISSGLKTAFPDLDYRFKVIGTRGDVVRATSQLSGTHRGPLDLTGLNLGVLSPTNRTFTTRVEKTKISVRENRITAWIVEPAGGAGLLEILSQLETESPAV